MCGSSADDPSMHDIAPDEWDAEGFAALQDALVERIGYIAHNPILVMMGMGLDLETPDPLREAAERIALEDPWVGWDSIYCRHCSRDWYLNGRNPDQTGDRRAHEPDCSWIALRDALGMYSG